MQVIEYLFPQRLVQDLEELLEILMEVWGVLHMQHELDDLFLHIFGKLHRPHSSIDKVQLLINVSRFLVHSSHKSCHITENKGGHYSSSNDNDGTYDCLSVILRCQFISSHSQYSIVEHYEVLIH